ncbi:MAG: PKD domain-containing protein [Oceanipulchritudo sp.]
MNPARIVLKTGLLAALLVASAAFGAYDYYEIEVDDGDKLTNPFANEMLRITVKDGSVSRVLLTRGSNPFAGQSHYLAIANPAAHLQVPTGYRSLSITVGPTSISGTAALTSNNNAADSLGVLVDLAIVGDALAGTVEIDGQAFTARGTRYLDSRQKTEQDIPAGINWPRMTGPVGNSTATPHGAVLLERIPDFRMAWISEEMIAAGAAGGAAGDWLQFHPQGGSSGPVVAEGLVFINYYVPGGEILYNDTSRQPWVEPWNRIEADDVVVAMDARTGETAWKRVFPLRGMIWPIHKSQAQGMTCAYRDGVLYAIGSIGHLDALDARTGAVLWTARLPGMGGIDTFLSNARAAGSVSGGLPLDGRGGGHSLNVAEDVLLACGLEESPNVHGFDTSTGSLKWTRTGINGKMGTPAVWVHGGREYVLVLSEGDPGIQFDSTLRCLDPQDGTEVWMVGGLGSLSRELHVNPGDLLFLPVDAGNGSATWACFELGGSGMTERWNLGTEWIASPTVGAMAPGGGAFASGGKGWLRALKSPGGAVHDIAVDLPSGAVHYERLSDVGGIQETTQYASDNLVFIANDEQHGTTYPLVYSTDLSLIGQWYPLHPPATGYSVPWTTPIVDGRIFFRGNDAIYAYDLRQHPDGAPYAVFTISPDTVSPIEDVATFDIAPDAIGQTGQVFTFDASPSVPGSAGITGYSWDFGDGNVDTGIAVQHAFSVAGQYRVTLTVIDADGKTHRRVHTIGVSDGPPAGPADFQAVAASETEILLRWTDVSDGELGFRIERRLAGETQWNLVAIAPPNTTDWTDTGLTTDTGYEYRMLAFNEGHASTHAGPLSVRTLDQIFIMYFEAECGDAISSDRWAVIDDPAASNGQYLEALVGDSTRPPPAENVIEFPFEAPFTANYKVWAYAYGAGGGNDSMHFAMDDDWFYSFSFCCTVWDWWSVETYTGLEAGPHIMRIAIREQGARFDKLFITSGTIVPAGLDQLAANCGSSVVVTAPLLTDLTFHGTEIDIGFFGEAGMSYQLEEAHSLQGPWTPVSEQQAIGSDAPITFTGDYPFGSGRKFFRVDSLGSDQRN